MKRILHAIIEAHLLILGGFATVILACYRTLQIRRVYRGALMGAFSGPLGRFVALDGFLEELATGRVNDSQTALADPKAN